MRRNAPRRAVVLGEPGIGKSRLADAFVSRVGARARAVSGRCRPYGDEAGLRPLRDILAQLEPLDAALAGETDPARIVGPLREQALAEPSDAFWAFRRLLEVSASGEPLVVVLEDVHWASPDLLDLVEYVLGWAAAPLVLLCVARPELLESRPEWRDDALVLGPIFRRGGANARRATAGAGRSARERGQRGGRRGRREPVVPGAARRLRGRGRTRSASAHPRGFDRVTNRPPAFR